MINIPHNSVLDGPTIEPSVSLPMANVVRLAETATAEPDDEDLTMF